MMPASITARFIEASIREFDYFRCSPARTGGVRGHKEWQHFIVHGDDVQALVNFNLIDDHWTGGAGASEVVRVIVLARTRGRWIGGMDRFDAGEATVRPGDIGMRAGPNSMSFQDGRYAVRVALSDVPIAADLTFSPATIPMLVNNQPLSRDRVVSWMFVPRLACAGTITIGNEHHRVHAAPAYHDHNWGHFAWGEDFTWEWGSALSSDPHCPWSMVYTRMSDLGRNVLRAQGLLVWRGVQAVRLFRDDEIELCTEGRLTYPAPLKLPPVMALLSPGGAHDLPEHFQIRARGAGDHVELAFTAEDVVQIIVPNDGTVDGVTVLNEVCGRITAFGTVRGAPVSMEGPGVFEFVRA